MNILLLLGSMCAWAVCSSTGPVPAAAAHDEALMRTFHAFAQHTTALDKPAMLPYMAHDVVLIDPRRGESAYDDLARDAAQSSQLPSTPRPEITYQVQDVRVDDDLAVLRIHWTAITTNAQGARRVYVEKDMEVWVKRAGEWKLWRGLSFVVEPAAAQ